ncbi:MAG: recombinase family protein [Caulobacteraceae bacterium]|nr:recombinase family protein [Caulobacteraceae bacterium]
MSPGALAVILGNPIYRGLIAHRDKTYSGRHDAIVDKDLWQAVQARRIANKAAFKSMPKRMDGPLLLGRIQDDAGNTMRISHTRKGDRRYRYYVSAALLDGHGKPGSLGRISAGVLDRAVLDIVAPLLSHGWRNGEAIAERVLAALLWIKVSAKKVHLALTSEAIDECTLSILRLVSAASVGRSCLSARSHWRVRVTPQPLSAWTETRRAWITLWFAPSLSRELGLINLKQAKYAQSLFWRRRRSGAFTTPIACCLWPISHLTSSR